MKAVPVWPHLRFLIVLCFLSICVMRQGAARAQKEPVSPRPEQAAKCGDDELSEAEIRHKDAVIPEPQAPQLECVFRREVRCIEPRPVRSAWQLPPFTACPRTIPRWQQDRSLAGGASALFSRKETRKARLTKLATGCGPTPDSGVCCYVQFTSTACD
jgi:hypothetical protein